MTASGTVLSQPRYQQIKDTIRRRILAGEWPKGGRLPSEHELLAAFGVSRMTVHRALRDLTEEGLLTRIQGVGTFVAEQRPSMEILELHNIADEIAARGNSYSCQVEQMDEVQADGRLARQFNLPVGARLFHSVVVHRESDVPLQLEERWVNPAIAPDYLGQDFHRITPTAYLTGLAATPDVEHVIEAVLPDPMAARLLAIPETEPCLRVSRQTWVQGHAVTVAMLLHPGSRYCLGTRFKAGAAPLSLLAPL